MGTISVKLKKTYSVEDMKSYDHLLGILLINMYGENEREGGIYIKNFNYDSEFDQVCMHIASSLKGLYKDDIKIYIECGFFNYIKFLYNSGMKKMVIRKRHLDKGRTALSWCSHISNANNKNITIWSDIRDYIDE